MGFGNRYWWKVLRGRLLLLFPKNLSAVTNESLIPYNLIKRGPETEHLIL